MLPEGMKNERIKKPLIKSESRRAVSRMPKISMMNARNGFFMARRHFVSLMKRRRPLGLCERFSGKEESGVVIWVVYPLKLGFSP